jgi:hypothetical protein
MTCLSIDRYDVSVVCVEFGLESLLSCISLRCVMICVVEDFTKDFWFVVGQRLQIHKCPLMRPHFQTHERGVRYRFLVTAE